MDDNLNTVVVVSLVILCLCRCAFWNTARCIACGRFFSCTIVFNVPGTVESYSVAKTENGPQSEPGLTYVRQLVGTTRRLLLTHARLQYADNNTHNSL